MFLPRRFRSLLFPSLDPRRLVDQNRAISEEFVPNAALVPQVLLAEGGHGPIPEALLVTCPVLVVSNFYVPAAAEGVRNPLMIGSLCLF